MEYAVVKPTVRFLSSGYGIIDLKRYMNRYRLLVFIIKRYARTINFIHWLEGIAENDFRAIYSRFFWVSALHFII